MESIHLKQQTRYAGIYRASGEQGCIYLGAEQIVAPELPLDPVEAASKALKTRLLLQ